MNEYDWGAFCVIIKNDTGTKPFRRINRIKRWKSSGSYKYKIIDDFRNQPIKGERDV